MADGLQVRPTMLSEQREFDTPRPVSQVLHWIVLAALIGLTVLLLISRQFRAWGGRHSAEPPHPAVGQKLEHLALEPLTGASQALTLDDLAGKVVLINIWGTWCGPCRDEFPHLVELVEHYGDLADFRFVSVSCGDDASLAEFTAAFLKEMQADFPTYADPTQQTTDAIAQLAGQSAVPTTLVVGRDGKVRGLWLGYRSGLTDEMRVVIDAALAAKPG